MTNPASNGPASRWPLPDPRTAEQRERDKAAARLQHDVLSTPNQDPAARARIDQVVDQIRQRQVAAGRRGTPFDRIDPPGSDRPVLVAQDQLVIRADQQALAGAGDWFGAYSRHAREGRKADVYRARNRKGHADLAADARRLREQKITANVNVIVPLGYIIKGDAYPGATAVAPDYVVRPVNPTEPLVRVAIVDTGITDQTRDDGWLDNVINDGTDELNIVAPFDRNDWLSGHGTFTAGIVRQVAPGVEIVVYRFTGADGVGTDTAAADALIQAADEGVAAGRRLIINASFGVTAVGGVPPVALQEAVEYITEEYPDVLIVASAGNDGTSDPLYPAAFPGVIGVGALNADLTPAAFSSSGDWVEISTVGVGVVSTFVEGKLPPEPIANISDVVFGTDPWAVWSGTSFTAPQISGAVAALCNAEATLTPRAAFDDQLIPGLSTEPGYGAIIEVLPGTPTS